MLSAILKWMVGPAAPRAAERTMINAAPPPVIAEPVPPPPPSTPAPLPTFTPIPKIHGPGSFAFDVVGESYYLKNFEKICGPRGPIGVELELSAHLELDDGNPHDSQAVKVSIQGLQVGHLSRDLAREFRRAVIDGKLTAYKKFECRSTIRGGWDDGKGSTGHYGVRIDLPESQK